MELLECIKDNDYHPESLKFIKNFPVRGSYYTVRKRQHTINGLGYILDEISNPIMSNGKEPSFSSKRFKAVDSPDELINELTEILEFTI